MLAGEAQTLPQDSATPSATTAGSLNAFASCACMAPTPHPFRGCVGSVQFDVLVNGVGCPGSAETPLPDITFQKPILIGASAAAAGTAELAASRNSASARRDTQRAARLFIVGPGAEGFSCRGDRGGVPEQPRQRKRGAAYGFAALRESWCVLQSSSACE